MKNKPFLSYLTEINPVKNETGSSYQFINNNFMTAGKVALEPEHAHPVNSHNNEEECYFVLAGEGSVTLDLQEYAVAAGSFIYIPRGVTHSLRNTGKAKLEYLFFGAFTEPLV